MLSVLHADFACTPVSVVAEYAPAPGHIDPGPGCAVDQSSVVVDWCDSVAAGVVDVDLADFADAAYPDCAVLQHCAVSADRFDSPASARPFAAAAEHASGHAGLGPSTFAAARTCPAFALDVPVAHTQIQRFQESMTTQPN